MGSSNGNIDNETESETTMEVEPSSAAAAAARDNSILSNPARFDSLISFGRQLHIFSDQLEQERGRNSANNSMLQEAFSLLAYADPWNSPVGAQLDPARRETICSALNSAILGKFKDYTTNYWLLFPLSFKSCTNQNVWTNHFLPVLLRYTGSEAPTNMSSDES